MAWELISSGAVLESCRMLHPLTVLKCPTRHDGRSAYCSAAISTCSLLAGPEETWPAEPHAIPWHTAEAGASQSRQLGVSCLACCWKVCLKGTSGSHIGCNASPGLSFCRCKMCGLYDLFASTEVKMWSCLRRCLDCYQVGCWHKGTDDIYIYTHTSSEPVCSVTQPRDKSGVSQCHTVLTLTGFFVWERQKAPLLEACPPSHVSWLGTLLEAVGISSKVMTLHRKCYTTIKDVIVKLFEF